MCVSINSPNSCSCQWSLAGAVSLHTPQGESGRLVCWCLLGSCWFVQKATFTGHYETKSLDEQPNRSQIAIT